MDNDSDFGFGGEDDNASTEDDDASYEEEESTLWKNTMRRSQ